MYQTVAPAPGGDLPGCGPGPAAGPHRGTPQKPIILLEWKLHPNIWKVYFK